MVGGHEGRVELATHDVGRDVAEAREGHVDTGLGEAGRVDEDVEVAGRFDERERLLTVGEVGDVRGDLGARSTKLLRALLDPFGRGRDGHARAEPREQARAREADPGLAPAAGHERGPAIEVERVIGHLGDRGLR